jgi:hypothetical protein
MALAANIATLVDWAKRLDPDGKTSEIVELLGQTNEILADMQWMEGNLPTGHRTTVRTGLPTVAWRLLNGGVLPSKSTTAQIDEACAMLESWSEVDKDLAELNGNVATFRLSEAKAFIEAMNQEMASTLFYGNSSISAEEFTGLSIRYSDLDATNGQNIVNGEGAGGSEHSSIWLVVWGSQSIFGIFPKGSKAGLQHDDLGLETVENTAGIGGSRMLAFRERWQWKCGIALKDWRYVVRGANIDVSNLVAQSSGADLINMMIKMLHRVPNLKLGKPVFYMNRTLFQMLDIMRRDDVAAGGGLVYASVDGVLSYSFRGVPIRICDALLETEAAVTT